MGQHGVVSVSQGVWEFMVHRAACAAKKVKCTTIRCPRSVEFFEEVVLLSPSRGEMASEGEIKRS